MTGMAATGRVVETDALVVKRTPYADADWIVTLFTSQLGMVSAIASGGRRSKRRFAGGLEAFHNLTVHLRSTRSDELMQLTDASISRVRHGLASQLLAMRTAGRALNWLRNAFPPKLVEPHAWRLVQNWLDSVDANPPNTQELADARLAGFGLKLLTVLGWSLELSRCVRCGKHCPPRSSAYVSPNQGGIVCRSCGGSGPLVDASLRLAMQHAANLDSADLLASHGGLVLSIVEQALLVHAGIE